MLLVRAAVRPGKKLGLQSATKNLQLRRCPYWLRQTVPNRCSRRREGSVANGGTHSAWSDQRWCTVVEERSRRRALRCETRYRWWLYSQFLIFTASLCWICLYLFTARLCCFFVFFCYYDFVFYQKTRGHGRVRARQGPPVQKRSRTTDAELVRRPWIHV